MKKELLNINSQGFSVVEILLSGSIFGLIVTALVGILIYSQESAQLSGKRLGASFVAEEGLEALRNIRDNNLSGLTNGTFGLSQTTSWSLAGSSDLIDNTYTRAVTITDLSSQRKSVTSNVTWIQNLQRNGDISLETRFTNWRRNLGNWSNAIQDSVINLSANADSNGVAIYKTSTSTYAIIVRSSSSDPEFLIYNITNPSSPTAVGSLELGTDAFDVSISGNNALVATASNSQELMVISLSSVASPSLVGSFNAAGNTDATCIALSGNTVFLGRNQSTDPEIYALSIANPVLPIQLGTLNTTNGLTKLALGQSDQYLYASSIDNAGELVIVSVSNPVSMSITSTYNASGNSDGTAVIGFSTYALLGRASGELHVLNLATPVSPVVVSSSFSLNSAVSDLSVGVGDLYLFATLNTGSSAVAVVDLSSLSSPSLLSSVAATANTLSIVYDYDLNRVIASSANNSHEVYIIKPN